MIRTTVRVENELGLHARAAARLVRLTARFESDIKFGRRNSQQQVDGKSILGILLLAAGQGTQLELIVAGGDENETVEAIQSLFRELFGEEK